MNESTLRTGWVCIATEGKAVDGRDITRDWLTDMAETYDPTYYTAVIWPDHDRWSSYGTVQALKTEEVDGKLKLFAILCPNRDLIYYNQSGQYQFCSIEPFENFADLGRTYLLGLGVTDEPASIGTTHLKFSKSNKGQAVGTSEPLDLSTFKLPKHEKSDGLITKFFSFLASHGEQAPQSPPSQPEDEEMTKEQFDQMLGPSMALAPRSMASAPSWKPSRTPSLIRLLK
ncbi:GPO family capsid scaffolding protein [Aeromonas rivipollensis]|uniref:GPO family capsid scaffolding protein n=1 Tax=Aeromonas rivipollensis TaxID=948519 RepID=UPI0027D96B16|nr:GPO family capsid scaffolding protein [uncultured Aeromonas sp.]